MRKVKNTVELLEDLILQKVNFSFCPQSRGLCNLVMNFGIDLNKFVLITSAMSQLFQPTLIIDTSTLGR